MESLLNDDLEDDETEDITTPKEDILQQTEIPTVPTTQRKKRLSKLVSIPDYFLNLEKVIAATHILCLDKGNPEVATHLLAVPISEYDRLDVSHVIPLENFGVNRLRNICTFFNRQGGQGI
jgi:hypothetical protein